MALYTLHEDDNRFFLQSLKESVIHAFAETNSLARTVNPYDGRDHQINTFHSELAVARF